MKKRILARSKLYIILLIVCIAYLVYLKLGLPPVPCIFYLLTGLKCPGCGVTGMALHIFQGNFQAACSDNPFLFICSPLIVFLIIYSEARYIRTGSRKTGKLFNFTVWTLVCAGIIFAIIRNLNL